MFVLREVHAEDIEGLLAVAEHLDSVNLPHDRRVLEELIELSEQSFSGRLDVFKRQYLFALFDTGGTDAAIGGARGFGREGRLIGTSMIHAQHGTRRSPHVFFDVITDERYSETLDRHFVHQVLRIGCNYNGPTEIGGLVLSPEFRRSGAGLGRMLSYVCFLYMALHRERFRDEILSELLPPLEPDGTSLLWEHLGRHFTGMSYQEADRISQTNKEFIRSLFPSEPIYTSLLPPAVRALVGQVGPETRGVEKMLRRIGFTYAERIDPFDGGPHFTARTDEITLVRESRRAVVMAAEPAQGARTSVLVCVERDRPPYVRAAMIEAQLDDDRPVVASSSRYLPALATAARPIARLGLSAQARALLDVEPGELVGILPA